MKITRVLMVAVLCAVVLALVGCSGGGGSTGGGYSTPQTGSSTGGASAGGTTVVEKGLAFEPAALEVKVGDTVTFKNEDTVPHNVKIDGAELGIQQPGSSVTWTAAKAGSFPYTCVIHPSMAGEITVK